MEAIYDCAGIFDSHAHYYDKRFADETQGVDRILEENVFGSGIEGVINVGTNNQNSRICVEQAAKYEKMYAAVGIHPEDVAYCNGDVERELEGIYELVADIETRRKNKIVAIGEIGYDYHYEGFDKLLQKKYFEGQLAMAKKLDIPVIVHDRDAHGDCLDAVREHKEARGVFHSFSGSVEMARELVKQGWYISFSGVLTFKNARKTVEVAQAIPLEKILIETDCPYLAPHPCRGRINHSGLMHFTAMRLAEIKNLPIETIIGTTCENTKALFGI